MTLEEIDALIDVGIDAGALVVTGPDWTMLSDTPGVTVNDLGGLAYRGLNVWLSDETRIADRNKAARLNMA